MEKENDWLPLESNPEVINNYINQLGFDTNQFVFHDLLSLDDWALEMIPRPVLGVVFLYPITTVQEEFRDQEEEQIEENQQIVSDKIFFMKQYAQNACGTVGVIHALANIFPENQYLYQEDSFLKNFIVNNTGKSPKEIGKQLSKDKSLEVAHKEAVDKGETEIESDVNTHFICFIQRDGYLYELDGTKSFPINHGETQPETFLEDCMKVIKLFMERDPDELRFTTLVLAPIADQ